MEAGHPACLGILGTFFGDILSDGLRRLGLRTPSPEVLLSGGASMCLAKPPAMWLLPGASSGDGGKTSGDRIGLSGLRHKWQITPS